MVKMGKNLYRDCTLKVPVWYDNRRVNLFFVKLGSGGKWKAFITNDLEIGFNKLMETYHIRWYLLELFWEIVSGIGEILKVDIMELFEEMIRDNQRAEEIMRIFSPVFEKKSTA